MSPVGKLRWESLGRPVGVVTGVSSDHGKSWRQAVLKPGAVAEAGVVCRTSLALAALGGRYAIGGVRGVSGIRALG